MKIYLIANGKTAIMPVVPQGIQIGTAKDAIEKETLKGKVYLKGKLSSKSISWSSLFPVHKYSFANSGSWNGEQYVKFINEVREKDLECRCVVVNDNGLSLFNALVDITEFSYYYDSVGDVNYSISVVELKQL